MAGTLPAALGNLARLQELDLNGNAPGLTGTIPVELGRLGDLQLLDLANNALTGDIPAALGDLANLKYLVLFDNSYPRVVEQGGHGRGPRRGADQRLPDADELPDMGQQPRHHRGPRRPPAIRVDGVAGTPDDVEAVRPIETHVQAVLHAGPEQHLVVGGRGLQLLGRVQVVNVHQATVGQSPEARYTFVGRMVVFEVLALQVFAALPPAVGPDEENPDVVLRAFTDLSDTVGSSRLI